MKFLTERISNLSGGLRLNSSGNQDKKADVKKTLKKRPRLVEKEISHLGRDVDEELVLIKANLNIYNRDYFISSHKPVSGPFLIKGRQLVHEEVCRYVDPMILKQIDFNEGTAKILNKTTRKVDEIVFKINLLESMLSEAKEDLSREVNAGIYSAIGKIIDKDIPNKEHLAEILEKIDEINKYIVPFPAAKRIEGINYLRLEERFRGQRDTIKQMQSIFVQFFEGCNNVLDIGCGRGEFLEILKDNGIGAYGIDMDKDMVDYCRSKGLDVEMADALTYLEELDDKSIDGIFLDQVVEHLEPNYMIKMLTICYEKMSYGSRILIGTVNPLSFGSLVNFYIDLTHQKPIHPLTLEFLLESANFREIQTKFFAKIPEEARLQRVKISEDMADKEKAFISIYNRNIDMLNEVIYGPQGYAVVGKK